MSARAILTALPYKMRQDSEDDFYRKYITECARILTENTAKLSVGDYIKAKYSDVVTPKPKTPERSGDEIFADIVARAGLEVTD